MWSAKLNRSPADDFALSGTVGECLCSLYVETAGKRKADTLPSTACREGFLTERAPSAARLFKSLWFVEAGRRVKRRTAHAYAGQACDI